MPYIHVPAGRSLRIAYEDTGGDGPVVVFSHGFLMNRTMFRPQVDALRDRYRCITWDQRGHGETATDYLRPFDFYDSANDLIELLQELGITRAVLAGMSQGGFLTLRAALMRPDIIRGMILMDTEAGLMPQAQIQANEGLLSAWLTGGYNDGLGQMIAEQIIGPTPKGSGLLGTWMESWGRTTLVNLVPSFNALVNRDDVTATLAAYKGPALITYGEKDQAISLDAVQALQRGMVNASLQIIPGAGHAANLTFPDLVNPWIEAFLAGLPA